MDSESDQTETGGSGGSMSQDLEALACVTCRSRKLKCDRVKPACARCIKASAECVYPESRRKPAVKRRNVRELEERLAQVEGLLRESAKSGAVGLSDISFDGPPFMPEGHDDFEFDIQNFLAGGVGTQETNPSAAGTMPSSMGTSIAGGPSTRDAFSDSAFPASAGELIGLGLSEALPPFELMEELNNAFFQRQHQFMPVIHPGRYIQAFYSTPHMRPPMCLQYAIWAIVSNGHERFSHYHDIFYRRARQYADADEMRGTGEHFVTVAHAQAWALIATDEARSMLFTRAAISSAKVVRLVEMMGLHRIDGDGHEMAPTIAPPKDWTEVEERRRIFWGAFSIDTHSSLSTGWPTLINPSDITTNLPASEDAFNTGREEKTCGLPEAIKGSPFTTFGGAMVVCHIFNEILRHVHRSKPTDNPADVEHGEFWKKHRELDNMLSSTFMFLPTGFRLPQNLRNPPAVHANLNLHASVICLHHAAIEKIDTLDLPESMRAASQLRLRNAAEEIVNIVRLTSHNINAGYKSPLAALSMYCATSVYVYIAKQDPAAGLSDTDMGDFECVIHAMEAIARSHFITQSFLQQVYADVERNGLSSVIQMPNLSNYRNPFGWASSNIPLLARSYLTKHTEIQTPLPGRLPLRVRDDGFAPFSNSSPQDNSDTTTPYGCDTSHKRKRTSPGPQSFEGPTANPQFFDWARTGTAPAQSSPAVDKDGSQGPGTFGGGLLRATGVTPALALTATQSATTTMTRELSNPGMTSTSPFFSNTNTVARAARVGDNGGKHNGTASFITNTRLPNPRNDPEGQVTDNLKAVQAQAPEARVFDSAVGYDGEEDALNMPYETAAGVVDPWDLLSQTNDITWPTVGDGRRAGGGDDG